MKTAEQKNILESSLEKRQRLSEREIQFFRQTGYLRAPHPFSESDLRIVISTLEEAFQAEGEPVRRDSQGRVTRLSRLFDRGRLFHEVFSSPLILGPLESLLGPNIEFVRNRHNHATINHAENKSARLHRDVLQWSRPVITAIVYLQGASLQSGCTHIIPSSQYLPFVGTPNNGGTWMDEHHVYAALLEQALPVPMLPGGILFFDSLAFHSAGVNTTKSSRLAITGAYHSVDELTQQVDPHREVVLGERLYRGDS